MRWMGQYHWRGIGAELAEGIGQTYEMDGTIALEGHWDRARGEDRADL